ncbi:MAG: hypothetical protein ACRDHZ_00495 [Ktedonobacteraceae bacterium]
MTQLTGYLVLWAVVSVVILAALAQDDYDVRKRLKYAEESNAGYLDMLAVKIKQIAEFEAKRPKQGKDGRFKKR